MTDLKATVAEIYAAFGRGDIPAILDLLADDVAWEHWAAPSAAPAGVPWLQPRTGKSGALELFQIIGTWSIENFQVLGIMVGDRMASAHAVIEARLPNGATLRDQEIHLWTFDEAGKVTSFRHFPDTAKHIAAARGG